MSEQLEKIRRIVEAHEAPAKEAPAQDPSIRTAVETKMKEVKQTGREWLSITESVELLNWVLAKKYPALEKKYEEPTATPLYQAAIRGGLKAPKDPGTKMRRVDPESLIQWLSRYMPRTPKV